MTRTRLCSGRVAVCLLLFLSCPGMAGHYTFTVRGGKTWLNGREFLVKGLRCSNALISDRTTQELIDNLDTFAGYGVNTISVYFMGSRFGDVKGYCNVFVDIDNEGMAQSAKGFDPRQMVLAGKAADPCCIIATNFKGVPPAEADLAIHHSKRAAGKPYIESEGSSGQAPGGYWGTYSKKDGYYNYINIGVHTEAMKADQIEQTAAHLSRGEGYMLASTWLQCVAPYGPNHRPGGNGTVEDPGVRWWLEFLRDRYGPYRPPAPGTGPEQTGNTRQVPSIL